MAHAARDGTATRLHRGVDRNARPGHWRIDRDLLRRLRHLDAAARLRRPDRLVRVHEANPANGQLEQDVSIGTFHAWREGAASIEAAALFGKSNVRFLSGRDSAPVSLAGVSPNFLKVLGVRPLLGEGFKPEPSYTRFTADDDVIISYAAWQRLLGGRADVIGQSLVFEGVGDPDVYRIVGVMAGNGCLSRRTSLRRSRAAAARKPPTRHAGRRSSTT